MEDDPTSKGISAPVKRKRLTPVASRCTNLNTILNTIADTRHPSPLQSAIESELREDVERALRGLHRREQMVIRLLHGLPLGSSEQRGITYSYEQAATVIRSNAPNIRLSHVRAHERLRRMPTLRKHAKD